MRRINNLGYVVAAIALVVLFTSVIKQPDVDTEVAPGLARNAHVAVLTNMPIPTGAGSDTEKQAQNEHEQYDLSDSIPVFVDKVSPEEKQQRIDAINAIRQKDVKELSADELKAELLRVKASSKLTAEEEYEEQERKIHQSNPLYGTPLDNEEKRNMNEAPLPKDYIGKMTNQYVPYEQFRVVKEEYGNPDKVPGATFFTLVRNSELYQTLESMEQVEARFNSRYHYDWVFVNDEPFTKEFIEMTSMIASGTTRYGIIPAEHWSYPDYVDQNRAKTVRESRKFAKVVYGDSESYRFMCRYNSMFFYQHPIMQDYELYWRVEPSVSYMCDILEDPFKYLKDTGKQYGFTIAFSEFVTTVETLWATSKEYFSKPEVKAKMPGPDRRLEEFVSNDGGETYNMCHFWTNFEVANMTFWRSELYQNYVDYLDHAGGFFYERWGDAPVHSIAVSMLEDKSKIHVFSDISYKHTVAGTCPLDDDLWKKAKCTCDQSKDWTMNPRQQCNRRYLDVSQGEGKLKDYNKYWNIVQKDNTDESEMNRRAREVRREAARRRAVLRRAKFEQRRKQAEAEKKKKQAEAEKKKAEEAAAAEAKEEAKKAAAVARDDGIEQIEQEEGAKIDAAHNDQTKNGESGQDQQVNADGNNEPAPEQKDTEAQSGENKVAAVVEDIAKQIVQDFEMDGGFDPDEDPI